MKAKVLIPFRDKETKKLHKKNETINITAKRFNEIIRQGKYLEALDETETKPTKA